jgi:hypothetical protein
VRNRLFRMCSFYTLGKVCGPDDMEDVSGTFCDGFGDSTTTEEEAVATAEKFLRNKLQAVKPGEVVCMALFRHGRKRPMKEFPPTQKPAPEK